MDVHPSDLEAIVGAIEGMGNHNADAYEDLLLEYPPQDNIVYVPKEEINELSDYLTMLERGWGSCDDIGAAEYGYGLVRGEEVFTSALRGVVGPTHVITTRDGIDRDPVELYLQENDYVGGFGAILGPLIAPVVANYVKTNAPRLAKALTRSGFSPMKPPKTLRDKIRIARAYAKGLR